MTIKTRARRKQDRRKMAELINAVIIDVGAVSVSTEITKFDRFDLGGFISPLVAVPLATNMPDDRAPWCRAVRTVEGPQINLRRL